MAQGNSFRRLPRACLGFGLALLTALATLVPFTALAKADTPPAHIINLVYDDSGSMSDGGNKAWSQAKYGLEVMAAMLNENDTLNIYPMSQFESGAAGQIITLDGSTSPADRVRRIHDGFVPADGGTPFQAVRAAQQNLARQDPAARRWLVVLTDGQFQNGPAEGLDQYFATATAGGMQAFYLGIGSDAAKVAENAPNSVFSASVADSSQVIEALTNICNQMFERNSLPVTGNSISFDVAMRKILVFAQGKSVDITSIEGGGTTYQPVTAPAVVKYSTKTAQNANPAYDDNLQGQVAEFPAMPAGNYQLNVSGAEQVSVYYEPDVGIGMWLIDQEGRRYPATGVLKDGDTVPAGTYTVQYSFTDDQGAPVTSTLLGDVSYNATAENNGQSILDNCAPGCSITIAQGDTDIHLEGGYLKYNTISDDIHLTIGLPNLPLTITLTDPGDWTSSNFDNHPCVTASVSIDNEPLTNDLWQTMDVLTASSTPSVQWQVTKGDTAPTFQICPVGDNDKYNNPSQDVVLTVTGEVVKDGLTHAGSADITLQINDDIAWLDRAGNWFAHNWWKALLGLLALILLLGYVPPFKHRFKYAGKGKNKRPKIESTNKFGDWQPDSASSKLAITDTWIPYRDEHCAWTYWSSQGNFLPGKAPIIVQLVAQGGGKVKILNTDALVRHGYITTSPSLPKIPTDARKHLDPVPADEKKLQVTYDPKAAQYTGFRSKLVN